MVPCSFVSSFLQAYHEQRAGRHVFFRGVSACGRPDVSVSQQCPAANNTAGARKRARHVSQKSRKRRLVPHFSAFWIGELWRGALATLSYWLGLVVSATKLIKCNRFFKSLRSHKKSEILFFSFSISICFTSPRQRSSSATGSTPFSPPSGLAQRLFQERPAKANS
jgi:hypothetical protein